MIRLAARITVAFSLLLAMTLTSPAVAADKTVTPQGMTYSVPVRADGSLRAVAGSVTPFGPISGLLTLQVTPLGTFSGEFVFLAKGGWVQGTLEGYFTSATTYVETLTFTGGGGKFARVSGYVDVSGSLNPDGSGIDEVLGGQITVR